MDHAATRANHPATWQHPRHPRPAGSHAKSALRALDVLELLARRVVPQPAAVIARECAIPKSSTHHLLNAMHDRGFVTYFPDEHAWGLGPKVMEVGGGYQRSEPLQRLARPILTRLAAETGETAHLAILVGVEVLYLAKERPPGPAPALVTEVGVRLPAHLAATGQAILARLPSTQLRALYADRPLVLRTGRGPATIAALAELLDQVRQTGHAVEEGLVSRGISCAAAAVTSVEGLPAAAVGLTWVTAARDSEEVTRLVADVRRAAERLSRVLVGDAHFRALPGG